MSIGHMYQQPDEYVGDTKGPNAGEYVRGPGPVLEGAVPHQQQNYYVRTCTRGQSFNTIMYYILETRALAGILVKYKLPEDDRISERSLPQPYGEYERTIELFEEFEHFGAIRGYVSSTAPVPKVLAYTRILQDIREICRTAQLLAVYSIMITSR